MTDYVDLPRRIISQNPFFNKYMVSYGIVAYSLSEKKWLLVKRKYSPSFVNFVRGSYRNSYLYLLFEEMFISELEIIRKFIKGEINFEVIYNQMFPQADDKSKEYAKLRFDDFQKFRFGQLPPGNDYWIWPKGRRNPTDILKLDTAKREFQEETGICITDQLLVSEVPIIDYQEYRPSLTARVFETHYWVYLFFDHIEIPQFFDSNEISSREWISESEVKNKLNDSLIRVLYEAKRLIRIVS